MSVPSAAAARSPRRRLPDWLRPRDAEPDNRATREVKLIETAVVVLVGLLLAVATVNDVVRQVGINDRLIADIRTWRTYTGHNFHNVAVDQQLLGPASKRDVVCGNDVPGPPKEKVQACLVVEGATRAGKRRVSGGWYLYAHTQDDVRERRFGCFGQAAAGFCPR